MIEDLYWNGGNKLVGKYTKFFKHMILYTESSRLKYLTQGLIEVRENSNKERIRGIQNRRNVQSEIGDSSKCSAPVSIINKAINQHYKTN